MEEYLSLPWQTQLVVVAGYFGYIIAYSGRRSNHEAIDVAAITLCFGSVALFVLSLSDKIEAKIYILPAQTVAVLAIISSIAAGAVWRAFLRHWTHEVIRKISRSDEDGLQTAWESIIQKQDLRYTQLVVTLTNGRELESYPLANFNTWPNGPCVLGGDGGVGMYVTTIEENGQIRATNALKNEDGMRMTYIPPDQIQEIDFKRKA
jgi:hypothetical protein